MAQGIQCWNAQGTLLVDLGDYNMRYVGSQTVSLPSGATQWNFTYTGMTSSGWIVYIQDTASFPQYVCRCYDGGYRIAFAPTSAPATKTVTVDIWRYE